MMVCILKDISTCINREHVVSLTMSDTRETTEAAIMDKQRKLAPTVYEMINYDMFINLHPDQ